MSQIGLPNTMNSDNAKVFKLSSAEIKKLVLVQEVQHYMVNHQITWTFSVEKAPWWKEIWEKLVGSIKRCLRKTIG